MVCLPAGVCQFPHGVQSGEDQAGNGSSACRYVSPVNAHQTLTFAFTGAISMYSFLGFSCLPSLSAEILLPVAAVIKVETSLPAVKKLVNMLYSYSVEQAKRRHSSVSRSKRGGEEGTVRERGREGRGDCEGERKERL